MEFWNIANATIHQARQCIQLDHAYPDEIDLHISRLRQIQNLLQTLQQAHGGEVALPNSDEWATGISELITALTELQATPPQPRTPRQEEGRPIPVAPPLRQRRQGRQDRQHVQGDNQTIDRALGLRTQLSDTGGRPFIHIDMAIVHALLTIGYTRKELATLMGVSYKTLLRRLAKEPLRRLESEDLDTQIARIVSLFPSAGQRLLQGTIRSTGVAIIRREIQESLLRVDPLGALARTAIRLPRRIRRYWVPYANAVWHFDGHEKLKRWVSILLV